MGKDGRTGHPGSVGPAGVRGSQGSQGPAVSIVLGNNKEHHRPKEYLLQTKPRWLRQHIKVVPHCHMF